MMGLSSRRAAIAWAALLAAAALWFADAHGWRHGALWLIGAALGIALLQAGFGFTGGFRAMIAERRGAGFRAQLLLIAMTLALFTPVLAAGEAFGQPVRGFVFPIGIALLVGAFLFGIGMQLGGGCGSGTLYTAGGGSLRMLLTLAFFVAGATLAAWQGERWMTWPALAPVSLAAWLTPWGAAAVSLAILGGAGAVAARLERARHGALAPIGGHGSLAFGPWPLAWGAAAIALLSLATLVVAGRPWAITAAFPLWGSRLIETVGLDDPAFWPYWEDPTRTEALLRPVLADRITVMDLGVMAGAAFAARLGGRGGTHTLPRPGEAAGSIIGGLLLGIGATLGMGCNISAYLGGIASGSLHGWAWIIPAFAGNVVGVMLRPLFGLSQRIRA
jgi:uncharacterized membrane protein YedE/YeeE